VKYERKVVGVTNGDILIKFICGQDFCKTAIQSGATYFMKFMFKKLLFA
jgi:hypothetical protein